MSTAELVNSQAPPPLQTAPLEVCNVSKCYGNFQAVREISFTLRPGCICGFLGPNGAGKTTTIRMILDIIRPTSGRIQVLGRTSALEVRDQIGYLPEEKGLYRKMKAWAVITYLARLKGMDRRSAKHRAFELLERYGLKNFAENPIDALSKGMAQKVQMLAAIAHDPDLVILDEPFSGLDPVNQQVMEEIIWDLARRQRTILFSTHVMQHAERLCDRIILLHRGRKIFDGTIAEARRRLSGRIRIETVSDISPLQNRQEVISINPAPEAGRPESSGHAWEIAVRENTDPQLILQACLAGGIQLRSFTAVDPTLHEVFVHLVGREGEEEQS